MQHARPHSQARTQSGFTLIELMVTVAIAAVLLVLAAPSLRETMIKNRMASVGNQFSSHVLQARNEAVSRNTCTIMCVSTNTDATIVTSVSTPTGVITAGPQCAAGQTDWQKGWIVFLKEDCVTGALPSRPEDYVVVRDSVGAEYELQARGATPPERIVFNASGRTDLNATTKFDLFTESASSDLTQRYGFNMCLDAIGRTRLVKWNQSCM